MKLPTAKTEPVRDISKTSVLLYGPSKIGKSTFASQIPNNLFLATEAGLNALNVYQQPVARWEDFLEACAELAGGNHSFDMVTIDTVDNLVQLLSDYHCKKAGVTHPGEVAHGKLYGIIKNDLLRVLTKLSHQPFGLLLIGHSQYRDLETRTGTKTRIVPTLSESLRQVVIGLVDIILLAEQVNRKDNEGKVVSERVLLTKPSQDYDAGDRFAILPEQLPLNWTAFRSAFEGKTATTKTNTTKTEKEK